jgi:ribonuclease BN (tRNA processing enzyme)
MDLTVLGAWGVATAGETSSFLLRDEGFALLIDTGMNPAFTLTRAGIRLVDVTHVFLSHCHADHISGFAAFVFSRVVQERRFGTAKPLTVYGNPGTLAAGRTLLTAMYPDRTFSLTWHEIVDSHMISVGASKFYFQPTEHTVPGLALRIDSSSGKRFIYTSDTLLSPDLVVFCEGADLLLGECFGTVNDFGPVAQQQKHLSAEDIGSLAQQTNTKKLILFHMHEPYRAPERRDALLAVVRSIFSNEVIFPTEGQNIPV